MADPYFFLQFCCKFQGIQCFVEKLQQLLDHLQKQSWNQVSIFRINKRED